MLGLRCGSVVSADTLVELLWGEDPPRTAAKALQTHISSLRRTLGDGFVLTEGAAAFAPGELNAYFRAAFGLTVDVKIYVEAVDRLNDVGAVCTRVTHGVSHEGFAAEWREVDVLMVEGNIVNRCEVFDEADLDAALVRFDELDQL